MLSGGFKDKLQAILMQGVLETANSIFKRFRNAFMSQSVNEDLSHSQQFVKPLLSTLQVGTFPADPVLGCPATPMRPAW